MHINVHILQTPQTSIQTEVKDWKIPLPGPYFNKVKIPHLNKQPSPIPLL